MNEELKKLDEIYRSIEHILKENVQELSEEELKQYVQLREPALNIYSEAISKFSQLIINLTAEEIIEAYQESSELLKANLGGYMYLNFNKAYIPTLIAGINNDDSGGYLYLGVLSKHLTRETFIPLVLKALQSKLPRTCDTALAFVRQMLIVEAISFVEAASKGKVQYIAEEAKMTLDILAEHLE